MWLQRHYVRRPHHACKLACRIMARCLMAQTQCVGCDLLDCSVFVQLSLSNNELYSAFSLLSWLLFCPIFVILFCGVTVNSQQENFCKPNFCVVTTCRLSFDTHTHPACGVLLCQLVVDKGGPYCLSLWWMYCPFCYKSLIWTSQQVPSTIQLFPHPSQDHLYPYWFVLWSPNKHSQWSVHV